MTHILMHHFNYSQLTRIKRLYFIIWEKAETLTISGSGFRILLGLRFLSICVFFKPHSRCHNVSSSVTSGLDFLLIESDESKVCFA